MGVRISQGAPENNMKFNTKQYKTLYKGSVSDQAINSYMADKEQQTMIKVMTDLTVSLNLGRRQYGENNGNKL